jgi:hypothetical protein
MEFDLAGFLGRHSRVGGNPVRSSNFIKQNQMDKLDSRIRGNDDV